MWPGFQPTDLIGMSGQVLSGQIANYGVSSGSLPPSGYVRIGSSTRSGRMPVIDCEPKQETWRDRPGML